MAFPPPLSFGTPNKVTAPVGCIATGTYSEIFVKQQLHNNLNGQKPWPGADGCETPFLRVIQSFDDGSVGSEFATVVFSVCYSAVTADRTATGPEKVVFFARGPKEEVNTALRSEPFKARALAHAAANKLDGSSGAPLSSQGNKLVAQLDRFGLKFVGFSQDVLDKPHLAIIGAAAHLACSAAYGYVAAQAVVDLNGPSFVSDAPLGFNYIHLVETGEYYIRDDNSQAFTRFAPRAHALSGPVSSAFNPPKPDKPPPQSPAAAAPSKASPRTPSPASSDTPSLDTADFDQDDSEDDSEHGSTPDAEEPGTPDTYGLPSKSFKELGLVQLGTKSFGGEPARSVDAYTPTLGANNDRPNAAGAAAVALLRRNGKNPHPRFPLPHAPTKGSLLSHLSPSASKRVLTKKDLEERHEAEKSGGAKRKREETKVSLVAGLGGEGEGATLTASFDSVHEEFVSELSTPYGDWLEVFRTTYPLVSADKRFTKAQAAAFNVLKFATKQYCEALERYTSFEVKARDVITKGVAANPHALVEVNLASNLRDGSNGRRKQQALLTEVLGKAGICVRAQLTELWEKRESFRPEGGAAALEGEPTQGILKAAKKSHLSDFPSCISVGRATFSKAE